MRRSAASTKVDVQPWKLTSPEDTTHCRLQRGARRPSRGACWPTEPRCQHPPVQHHLQPDRRHPLGSGGKGSSAARGGQSTWAVPGARGRWARSRRVGTIAELRGDQGDHRAARRSVRVIRNGVVVYPPAWTARPAWTRPPAVQGGRERGARGFRVRSEAVHGYVDDNEGGRRGGGVPYIEQVQRTLSFERRERQFRTEKRTHHEAPPSGLARGGGRPRGGQRNDPVRLARPRVKLVTVTPRGGVRRPPACQGLRLHHGHGKGAATHLARAGATPAASWQSKLAKRLQTRFTPVLQFVSWTRA